MLEIWPNAPGMVLRQVLMAEQAGDVAGRTAWLGRLNRTRQEDVRRLASLGDGVREALYRLTPYEGLWPAFDICRIRLLQRLRCPEVGTPLRFLEGRTD